MLHTLKKGAAATKRFVWDPANKAWGKTAYSMGVWFDPKRYRVSGIQSLAALIEKVRSDPTAFIIRGKLAEDRAPGAPVARRYLNRPGKPEPDFIDVPRAWLMCDIDGYAIPDGLDLVEDTETLVERAISELLPAEFHDVQAFWQLSSGAGFAEGVLKVHVWFYLDRHVETSTLKQYMALNARGIDRALFNAVQVHYVADPLVQGGADPIPRRTGWVQGVDTVVTLPDLDAAVLGEQTRQARRDTAVGAGLSASQATTLDGALAALGDGDGLEGFHDPLRRAAWLYATSTPTWQRSLAALKERMRNAILTAPFDIRMRSGIAEYLADDYLDRLILGAFEKVPNSGGWETCTPEHKLQTGDAGAARDRMQKAIGDFLAHPMTRIASADLALDPDLKSVPRSGLVVAEVGLGKSDKALREVVKFVQREKAAGRPHRVAYFVPEHRLGADLLGRARDLGISAATFYGRSYTPPGGSMMCRDIEAVELAAAVKVDVGKFVCGSLKAGEKRCVWRLGTAQCGYQFQKADVAAADMVVLAQAMMFSKLPTDVATDLGLVVIDESFWQSGLGQTSISIETFSQEPISQPVLTRDSFRRQVIDEDRTNELHEIRGKIEQAFNTSEDDYFDRRHAEIALVSSEDCSTASRHEWQRQRDVEMYPGMPQPDRKAAAESMAINGQLPRLHAFWMALRELLEGDADATGRIELQMQQRPSGSQRVALVNTRRDLTAAILECPILLLDGTGDIEIVRRYLPHAELIAEERPASPNVTIHQIIGPLSKTSLTSRPGLVSEVRDFLASKTEGKPALVVTHVRLEAAFEGMPNTDVAHFGAIAGRDEWGHVRHIGLLGRPQPSPDAIRTMAAQLTGRPVPVADPVRATRGVTMLDGTGVGIEVSRFDDPDAEMIRKAVTDAAIVQGGGRGRGINRSAANPLDIWIMGNVISPWPVAEILHWKDVALDPVSRMAVRGLVLFSPVDAHGVYPDLFVTAKAAQHAIRRGAISAPIPYNNLSIRSWGGNRFVGVSYRPKGRGQQSRLAWVAESRLPTLADELAAVLQMPVVVELVDPNPTPPSSPDPPRPDRAPMPEPRPEPVGEAAIRWAEAEDEAPWPDYEQPGPGEWDVPDWALEVGELEGEVLAQVGPKPSGAEDEGSRRQEVLLCDAPWLHPDVPAFTAKDGLSVVVCPFCCEQHRHHGFGHRLAHCREPSGRGYVLRHAGPAPPSMMHQGAVGAPSAGSEML